ncbi:FAD binding domain-containing protein [Mesorhizobium sp. BAC0120]|uniref:FAD binding domain-containing protein n=1 Tax=Mesorhizobium sp. BAC0120 TaxID=3090670 RepID=UPI00298CCC12|nr:FAD binding domain-containing protein [Mesorhizobium sp. BAC0120]MDW6020587.1 FAD binding domain-containing protein [Mesorhizobium sp. BAC0120]
MLQAVARPRSLAEAHSILESSDRSAIIAGGTAIMPVLNYGTDEFDNLVSLRGSGISGIDISGARATIGATTTLSEIEAQDELAFLRPALDAIGSPTIRNMATVGGNLFVKQPYGDFAACLIALGAEVTIAGPNGERCEPVEKTVASRPGRGEIVTKLSFALPAAGAFKFWKAARKAFNSAAIVTVAALVEMNGGVVSACRIALGGVANTAIRARSSEKELTGKPLDRITVEAVAKEALKDIAPFDDAYATAWYRARVTPVHVRRALLGA